MFYLPFANYFEEIAEHETKGVVFFDKSLYGIPAGRYMFLENYCADKNCDCQRVIIHVVNIEQPDKILATIGYGWESVKFYRKWIFGDKDSAKDMKGSYLEHLGPQSKHSQAFLKIWQDTVKNKRYAERLKRHYALFKKEGPDKSAADNPPLQSTKIKRNAPCPCGATKPNGKPIKYKYCCGKG